jgi:hypothetical protein
MVAHALRREPHRLLFPLGAALAGVGVLPWIPFALDLRGLYRPIFQSIGYRSIFHPVVEIQGALSCFAAGYIFTWIPHRTGARPPAPWQLAVAAAAPVAIVACAFLDRWAVAQAVWAGLLAVVLEFALRRTGGLRAQRRPELIWIAAGLVMGLSGGALAGLPLAAGGPWFWLHDVGRDLLLQGLFTGLSLGVAAGLLGAPPRASRGVHALAAALLAASFFGATPLLHRLGFAVRAGVAFLMVIGPLWATRLDALPGGLPGLRHRLTRLSMWMLPAGNAWVAVAPMQRRAGLHVMYLGCFVALALVLTGSLHQAQVPRQERKARFEGELALTAALLLVALVGRILLEMDPQDFHLWLGLACASFLFAAPLWATLARP